MKQLFSFKDKLGEEEYTFILKKPTRTESEEVDIFHSAIMSAYMNAGVQTRASVDKYYADNVGGAMPKEDEKELILLRKKLYEKEEQLIKKAINSEEKVSLYEEIMEINEKLRSFSSYYGQIYENTVEVKARNKAIDFCMLNFSHFKKGEEDPKKIFPCEVENPQKRMLKQMEFLDDLEDSDDADFWSRNIDKLLFGYTIWFLNAAKTEKDFERLFKGSFNEETENSEEEPEEDSEKKE